MKARTDPDRDPVQEYERDLAEPHCSPPFSGAVAAPQAMRDVAQNRRLFAGGGKPLIDIQAFARVRVHPGSAIWLVTEASDLGWAVGEWPPALAVIGAGMPPDGLAMLRDEQITVQGEFSGWIYRPLGLAEQAVAPAIEVHVLND
jgi:hypothetical protein